MHDTSNGEAVAVYSDHEDDLESRRIRTAPADVHLTCLERARRKALYGWRIDGVPDSCC